jgi:hypothetical protein
MPCSSPKKAANEQRAPVWDRCSSRSRCWSQPAQHEEQSRQLQPPRA